MARLPRGCHSLAAWSPQQWLPALPSPGASSDSPELGLVPLPSCRREVLGHTVLLVTERPERPLTSEGMSGKPPLGAGC